MFNPSGAQLENDTEMLINLIKKNLEVIEEQNEILKTLVNDNLDLKKRVEVLEGKV